MKPQQDVARLWDTKQFADMRIAVVDTSVSFDVHRLIVCPQSKYLSEAQIEVTAPMLCTVRIQNGILASRNLKSALEFCYKGDQIVERVEAEGIASLLSLYEAALTLGIDALVQSVASSYHSAFGRLLTELDKPTPPTGILDDFKGIVTTVTSTHWAERIYSQTLELSLDAIKNTDVWKRKQVRKVLKDHNHLDFTLDLLGTLAMNATKEGNQDKGPKISGTRVKNSTSGNKGERGDKVNKWKRRASSKGRVKREQ